MAVQSFGWDPGGWMDGLHRFSFLFEPKDFNGRGWEGGEITIKGNWEH